MEEDVKKMFEKYSDLESFRVNREGFKEYTYKDGKVETYDPWKGMSNTTIEKYFEFSFTPPYKLDKDGNREE